MADRVYVVMGSAGEYSDRTEWAVVAYLDEERAKQHVVAATDRLRVLLQWECSKCGEPWRWHSGYEGEGCDEAPVNEHDPSGHEKMMYRGEGRYYVLDVELREARRG